MNYVAPFLVIDLGNSRVKIAIHTGGLLRHSASMQWRDDEGGIDWELLLANYFFSYRDAPPSEVVLSSVVPSETKRLINALKSIGVMAKVEISALNYPFEVRYNQPRRLGADRLCDAFAAWRRIKGAAIAVDFGTAVTLNVVSEAGDFHGGAIIPGTRLAAKALSAGTAQLPEAVAQFKAVSIGKSTRDCIASGLTYGWVAMVDGLIDRFEAELGCPVRAISTGGGGREFTKHSRRIESYIPHLTLEGVAAIYRFNRERA